MSDPTSYMFLLLRLLRDATGLWAHAQGMGRVLCHHGLRGGVVS